jgi:hypothetical protein
VARARPPVDDDPDIRDFIERRIFRDRGFDDITTADDGETGLELGRACCLIS